MLDNQCSFQIIPTAINQIIYINPRKVNLLSGGRAIKTLHFPPQGKLPTNVHAYHGLFIITCQHNGYLSQACWFLKQLLLLMVEN